AFEANYLFYMAFEWCPGSLSDLLVEPLGPELAIELTRQILAATQYLHDNDVVHDDLHSGNVLFTHADRPVIKIADFGISKELHGRSKARPEVVHHAVMAPEVVAAGYTSRQSDIYQVGLLLYWMVSGKPPLDYTVPYNDLVRQVSDGLPRQRAEQLGTPLGAVIAKMLRRRDAYRYGSARDVWEELREVPEWRGRQLFREPPLPCRADPPGGSRARASVRRNLQVLSTDNRRCRPARGVGSARLALARRPQHRRHAPRERLAGGLVGARARGAAVGVQHDGGARGAHARHRAHRQAGREQVARHDGAAEAVRHALEHPVDVVEERALDAAGQRAALAQEAQGGLIVGVVIEVDAVARAVDRALDQDELFVAERHVLEPRGLVRAIEQHEVGA
ncbi:MAG TPA: protein kinase, partial [Polyangiaceae bacterium]|nr:protein kinase [Polyangiaceae bacterium]